MHYYVGAFVSRSDSKPKVAVMLPSRQLLMYATHGLKDLASEKHQQHCSSGGIKVDLSQSDGLVR